MSSLEEGQEYTGNSHKGQTLKEISIILTIDFEKTERKSLSNLVHEAAVVLGNRLNEGEGGRCQGCRPA